MTEREMDAELVPGDIVLMEAGNRVADGRLFVTDGGNRGKLTGECRIIKDTGISNPEAPWGSPCMAT
jgi:magnesium-transporting ATPase (P-type)